MPPDDAADTTASTHISTAVSDDFLIESMLGGDATALRRLMDRYDRLVRYTVFQKSQTQCSRDPNWLDTVASDAWTGFVQSLRRGNTKRPASVPAYLAGIARNRCISALRREKSPTAVVSFEDVAELPDPVADDQNPLESVAKSEQLATLQACMDELSGDDRQLVDQLEAITGRKWRLASEALGLPESTVRSRWKLVLQRLRGCVRGKTGETFAPWGELGD